MGQFIRACLQPQCPEGVSILGLRARDCSSGEGGGEIEGLCLCSRTYLYLVMQHIFLHDCGCEVL